MIRYSRVFSLFASLMLLLSFFASEAEEVAARSSWRVRYAAAIEAEKAEQVSIEHWLTLLSDTDYGIIYHAITALPKRTAKELVIFERLLDIAMKSRVAPLRVAASEKLATADSLAFATACISRMSRDAEPKDIQVALDAVGYLDAARSVKVLSDVIKKSPNVLVSQHAFKVLLRQPTLEGLALLKDIANDSEAAPALRTQAIGSMRVFPFYDAIESLIALLQDADIEIVDAAWVNLMAVSGMRLEPEPVEWESWWEQAKPTYKHPTLVSIPATQPANIAEDEIRAAIDLGVDWLIAHQDKDGRFNSTGYALHDPNFEGGVAKNSTDVCMTALAVIAMISVGLDGGDEAAKARDKSVAKAMAWLVLQPTEAGNYRSANFTTYVHEQGLATWALAEYVVSGHSDYERPMLEAFAKCMEFRDEDRAWGYPNMLDNTTNSCVTYWYACAFAAARRGGYDLPSKGWDGIAWWFDRSTEEYTGLIYNASAKEPSPAMTGAGLLVKSFLLWDMDATVQKRSASIILNRKIDKCSYYDLYMYTMGLSRLKLPESSAFISQISRRLVDLQDESKTPLRGSWDPNRDIWETSRLYTATMAITALSVPTSKLAALIPPLKQ